MVIGNSICNSVSHSVISSLWVSVQDSIDGLIKDSVDVTVCASLWDLIINSVIEPCQSVHYLIYNKI